MSEDREVKNIILSYDDGSTEVIEKGFVARFIEHEDGEATASFDLVSMGCKDLYVIVSAMLQLGDKLGFFNKKEDDGNV